MLVYLIDSAIFQPPILQHMPDVIRCIWIALLMCKQKVLQGQRIVAVTLQGEPAKGIVGVHVTLFRGRNRKWKVMWRTE